MTAFILSQQMWLYVIHWFCYISPCRYHWLVVDFPFLRTGGIGGCILYLFICTWNQRTVSGRDRPSVLKEAVCRIGLWLQYLSLLTLTNAEVFCPYHREFEAGHGQSILISSLFWQVAAKEYMLAQTMAQKRNLYTCPISKSRQF